MEAVEEGTGVDVGSRLQIVPCQRVEKLVDVGADDLAVQRQALAEALDTVRSEGFPDPVHGVRKGVPGGSLVPPEAEVERQLVSVAALVSRRCEESEERHLPGLGRRSGNRTIGSFQGHLPQETKGVHAAPPSCLPEGARSSDDRSKIASL